MAIAGQNGLCVQTDTRSYTLPRRISSTNVQRVGQKCDEMQMCFTATREDKCRLPFNLFSRHASPPPRYGGRHVHKLGALALGLVAI